MNATHAPHAGYAVVPSPRPRQAAHDLTLITLHNAIDTRATYDREPD